MNAPYRHRQTLRFGACDPAGIAFYPRLFEMLNAAVEDWADERLGCPFAEMHGRMRRGLPTARMEVEFKRPIKLGELVTVELSPTAFGRTSLNLDFHFFVENEVRLLGTSVFVWLDLDSGLGTPWPDDLRRRLTLMLPGEMTEALS